MKLTTIEVRGVKYDVDVNETSGSFSAEVRQGETVRANSLEELKEAMKKATLTVKARVAIEFFRWRDNKLCRGLITGIHATNRNLLVKWDGEKGVSQEFYYSRSKDGKDVRFLRLDPDQQREYTELCRALERAKDAVDAYQEDHGISPVTEVEEAMKAEASQEAAVLA